MKRWAGCKRRPGHRATTARSLPGSIWAASTSACGSWIRRRRVSPGRWSATLDMRPPGTPGGACGHAGTRRRLDLEGRAAAAGVLDVGVVELEAAAFQRLEEIHLTAVKVHEAHGVHKNLQIAVLDGLVLRGARIKLHRVAETATAATDHGHAQTAGRRFLLGQNFLHLLDRLGGECDHGFSSTSQVQFTMKTWPPAPLPPAGKRTRWAVSGCRAALCGERRPSGRWPITRSAGNAPP